MGGGVYNYDNVRAQLNPRKKATVRALLNLRKGTVRTPLAREKKRGMGVRGMITIIIMA